MIYRLLADALVMLHLAFVLFVVLGGFLTRRHPHLAWLHLPCVAWGAVVEFANQGCPLTPLENYLRHLGGMATYRGGFIEHYVVPIVYPEALTRELQIILGLGVVAINIVAYAPWGRGDRRNS